MSTDLYKALGVSKTATDAEIKKAYRKIARNDHPDLNPGDATAEQRFKKASAAYDILKDKELRGKYDRGEIDDTGADQHSERQYYRKYAEQPDHGYRTSHGYEDFGDMSDIFADILRQKQAQGAQQQPNSQFGAGFDVRGTDSRYIMEVGFLTAAKGGKQRITLPSGDSLEVTIPQGTSDGQTIRLKGKGDEGYGKGQRGDAYVTVNLRPHKTFTREGDDIRVVLPITIDEAVLGGKVSTPTIDGTVNLTIPAGASSGQTLRLRGRGVKRAEKPAGDQMVELKIVVPATIDAELRDFMTEWRKKNAFDPRKSMLQGAE